MKIRNGFVSNSSSSSFVVNGNDLSFSASQALLNYNSRKDEILTDYWDITDSGDCIRGHTNMDNGDLDTYCETMKIDMSKFNWSEY